MSVDIGWMTASAIKVSTSPQGEALGDGNVVDTEFALALEDNETFMIEGTPAELSALAGRISQAVDAKGHWELLNAVTRVRAAARGDSNDTEIEELQEALDMALALLGREDLRA